jgi:hypothetical protein
MRALYQKKTKTQMDVYQCKYVSRGHKEFRGNTRITGNNIRNIGYSTSTTEESTEKNTELAGTTAAKMERSVYNSRRTLKQLSE